LTTTRSIRAAVLAFVRAHDLLPPGPLVVAVSGGADSTALLLLLADLAPQLGLDLHVAHFLVQGCDVWLNNPRKPLEASGTSGMKAAINGVPHLSIGDGWWAEGFSGANGWVIDGGVTGDNSDAVDAADAHALYRLLEEQIVPAFYERDAAQVPHRWVATIKEAIRTVAPRFGARRMVKEYVERMYAPALDRRLTKSQA